MWISSKFQVVYILDWDYEWICFLAYVYVSLWSRLEKFILFLLVYMKSNDKNDIETVQSYTVLDILIWWYIDCCKFFHEIGTRYYC